MVNYFIGTFDNKGGNSNVCVVGRSGSGKSVFMQDLVKSILDLGGNVYVLDVGRSFEKQVNCLGGQFIEFSTHDNEDAIIERGLYSVWKQKGSF